MTKVTYERGKTMTYPTMYPRLLVTPIFAHEDDFRWIEKIVCKYDTETDIDEPEFSFRRDTVHSERNDVLKAENAKLRKLVQSMYGATLICCGDCWLSVPHDPAMCGNDNCDQRKNYLTMRELGIEVKGEGWMSRALYEERMDDLDVPH